MRAEMIVAVAVAVAAGAGRAGAQAPGSPYAGQEARAIKALSEEEVRAYLQGEGMGLAKAAELNRYPGPRHVLDLADRLGLTEAQRARVEASFAKMKKEAVALGAAILEEEKALDAAFAGAAIDEASLRTRLGRIAELQGRLRGVHLAAHLETRSILTGEQVDRYVTLRGYDGGHAQHRH